MSPAPDPTPAPAHGPGRGLTWLAAAAILLREQPLRLLLLVLLFQLMAGLTQLGVLGLVFLMCVPALSAGLLQAAHECATGRLPGPMTLLAAFRSPGRLPALLLLGVICLLTAILAVGGVLAGSLSQLDPELLLRIEAGDPAAVAELDPGLLQRAFLALSLGLLTSAALSYFAVPLIWFEGRPLGGALWQGLLAMLRQWLPLLVLGLLCALLALPLVLGFGMVLTLQGSSPLLAAVASFALLLASLAYQVLVFAAQYFAFRDIFHPGGGSGQSADNGDAEEQGGDRDDQLVA
jgi:hypothetical protein